MTTSTTLARATQTTSGGSPTLLRSFASEWTKLRTLRSSWTIAGVMAALMVAISGTATYFIEQSISEQVEGDGEAEVLLGAINSMPLANYFGVIAIVILGALIGSGDFQHRTAAPTLIHQPKRWQFLAAKTGFAMVTSAVLGVLLIGASIATAFVFVPRLGRLSVVSLSEEAASDATADVVTFGLVELMPVAVGHLVLAGLFGMALGLATRSTTFAVSGFFVLRFVEVAVVNTSAHWVTNLLPFRAGDRLLPYAAPGDDLERFASKPASAAIYLSVIAVLIGVGVVRTYKQDIA